MKNKIGFLISHSNDLVFLFPIIERVGSGSVIIIYENREVGVSLHGDQFEEIKNFNDSFFNNCLMISLEDMLKLGSKVNVLISIHPYIVGVIKSIAKFNIRLSYSIAKKEWQFGQINKDYQLILTQGYYSSTLLQSKFGKFTKEIGYPRYNNNFEIDIDNALNKNKRVITFFPTLGSKSVLDLSNQINGLARIFTVVVKIHPLENDLMINKYKSKLINCKIIKDGNFNQQLIRNSLINIHDTGGTCFSSLYLNANFVFIERDITRKKFIASHTPEEILYFVINRNLKYQYMAKDIASFISDPLVYSQNMNGIKKLFFTSMQDRKIDQTLKIIDFINKHIWLSQRFSKSFLLRFCIRIFGMYRFLLLEFKLRKILVKVHD